jgi:DNA invertase Pin-like site-specific DNA recombinase
MRPFLAILLLAFGLAACGEREQVVEQQSEKRYQGKRDGKPWDNAPLAAEFRGGTWTKGDERSWEEQIKQRQLGQHEHKRIYQ